MQHPETPLPAAEVNLSAVGEAFEHFKDNAGTWILAILIVWGIGMIFSFLMNGFSSRGASVELSVLSVVSLISLIIYGLLYAGLFRMATRQMRGETVTIGDLFDFGDVALQAILGSILTSIIIYLGLILCIIPGLIFSGLLMFTFPLIVDQKMSALEAIATSFNTLKSQWLMATVFIIVIGFIAMLGFLFCVVGALITIPLALLSITVAYSKFFIASGSAPGSGPASFEPAIPPGN